jgi:NAD(P)-dependent dehydrogenase (short-subunit alcohol dehydrogenase family)
MADNLAVMVTGGGRGLGRAIAERFGRDGTTVGLLARTRSEVDATADAIRDAGGRASGYTGDVLDPARLRSVFAKFHGWAGGIDALICAAGQFRALGPIAAVEPDVWWRDLETSVRGVQLSIREALPYLRGSTCPSITLLVGAGHNAETPFASGYGTAQAALARLAESLGHELAVEGIAVYAVHPGLVLTDLTRRWLDSPDGRRWLPQWTEWFAEGKEVGPEVTAEMVAWLVGRRPAELRGRVVAAPLSPTILETRLERIAAENLGVLRLR